MDRSNPHQQVLQRSQKKAEFSALDSEEHAIACVICLETISDPATACPCEHNNFDYLCLLSWLQQRPTCPLCECKPPQIDYFNGPETTVGNIAVRSVEFERTSPHDIKVYQVPPTTHKTSTSTLSPPPYRSQSYRQHPYRTPRSRVTRPASPLSADTALECRKYVYRHQLYSLHVGSNSEYISELVLLFFWPT